MNYDAAENCPGQPVARPGERSLIGPVYFHHQYDGWESEAPEWAKRAAAEDPDMPAKDCAYGEHLKELRVVIAALRETHRLHVVLYTEEKLRAEGAPEDETVAAAEKKALYEGGYLRISEAEPLVFSDHGVDEMSPVPLVEFRGFHGDHGKSYKDGCGVTSRQHPWVHIKLLPACSRQIESVIIKNLHQAGAKVALIAHAEETVELTLLTTRRNIEGAAYEMSVVHGEGSRESVAEGDAPERCHQRHRHELGSLFEIKRVSNSKTVGKVLVAYHNDEMGTAGPTIEIVEVAEGWREFGIGSMMMRAVEQFYSDLYADLCGPCGRNSCYGGLTLSACYVTTRCASKWFMKHCHFEDADGLGEELTKTIIEAEKDDALSEYELDSDDPFYEDGDLLDEGPPKVYRCQGTIGKGRKAICCMIELEWHGERSMPKERRFCRRCAQGKWNPFTEFPREIVVS